MSADLQKIIELLSKLSDEDKEKLTGALSEEPAKKTRGRAKKKFKNKFEDSPIFNEFKSDIEVDKKLSANVERSPRRKPAKMVKVACMKCNTICETDPSLVYYMSKTEYSFTCPKCQRGMKR